MSVIQTCYDTKDVLDFFRPQDLYLKPISRLNISVQLPQLKKSGAKISNWEVMERVKEMGKPFNFPVFRVSKSSLEFIRFEAEIENYGSMDQVLAKLDMKTIKLSGFHELLKVRAAEAKIPFPTRQDWDSYFRDDKTMNEMKAGERPDTIHVQNLPTKWFLNRVDKSGVSKEKPSEHVLQRVFGAFGTIRAVDIPMLDPYRDQMKPSISGIQTFTFGQDLVFDAYIQYQEYIGFVKAMNSLKGMKLLYKDRYEDRSWVANIKVDFDKTKHLAESTIKKRSQERERLIQKEREKEEAEKRKRELEELKRADELRRMEQKDREKEKERLAVKRQKEERRMERERRRKQQKLQKKFASEEEAIAHQIALEERKLLIAQRKLESIRLLDELLERVKAMQPKNTLKSIETDLLKTAAKEAKGLGKAATILSKEYKDRDEKQLRDKLVSKLKEKEMNKMKRFDQKIKSVTRPSIGSSEDGEVDQSMEEISDDDIEELLGLKKDNDDLEDVSDNSDLRLTASTDDDEFEEKKKLTEKQRKKEKKEKKRKKKEKKKMKEEQKLAKKKRKELENQILLAQRISAKERQSRSRSRSRSRDKHSRHRSWSRHDRSRSPIEPINPRQLQSQKRDLERQQKLLLAKQQEQAKEELYDRMCNPHLYGGGGGGGYRRLRKGEHYEDVQKRELEEHIKLKELERRRQQRVIDERRMLKERKRMRFDEARRDYSRSRDQYQDHGRDPRDRYPMERPPPYDRRYHRR